MLNFRRQLRATFPPKAEFTDAHVGDLTGKVYIVTGANTGIGLEVAKILYGAGGRVYIAGRSEAKCKAAIEAIKATHPPTSSGTATFLHLDLADLSTIKATAAAFLAAESRLDVLFNNAGVMGPPPELKTAQGLDLQLGTNCVGHFLLAKLLTPLLVSTAASTSSSSPNSSSVRVVWVSSSAAELLSPSGGGLDIENLNYEKKNESKEKRYAISKAGNYLHACEYARRVRDQGVVSVAVHPGVLETDLTRHMGAVMTKLLSWTVQYPAVYGAYTELFAGLSPEVGIERSGEWVAPWGRFDTMREDIVQASKHVEEGGTGIGLKFWEWSEEQVKPYL
ncbi:hypothetical protein MAPG_02802 [Magnaporthiopsis poae ATCC 64411]|uniref:Short-chain dehydrogenase n=1 Tax=Magnaporthiopsis poae (strain ATCC 64411 / 73-15) TaxID=644358 RepID=A0A0C4DSC4_MAGP6|nr:hypothetical protein MAPG_02802 [Magnaporthiopsis poae ATCC 64411]